MKTTKEAIEVMKAYLNNETIQVSSKFNNLNNVWYDMTRYQDSDGEEIPWNFAENHYRIKPKEKKKVKAEWVKTSFSRGSHNEWYITYGIRSFNPVDITPPDFIEIEVEK
jgi:hypothetical protein